MKPSRVLEDKHGLNPQQKKFAELFATDQELFGNGVQSYILAYELDQTKKEWYKTACQSASRLLGNVKVIAYINELLDASGFNDANVTKQHTFLINQFSDLSVKRTALSDYYKLKGKFAPEQLVVKHMTKEEVEKRLENL